VPVDSQANSAAAQRFLAGEPGSGRSLRSEVSGGRLTLFSYKEPIAIRESGRSLLVELEWKYSRTTDRHRKLLLGLAEEASFSVREITREEIRALAGMDPHESPRGLPTYPT